MELSVMSPVLAAMSLEDSLAYLKKLGVDSFEIGAGGYPGKAHLDPKDYLGKPEKIEELKALLKKYDMKISAVACHGNPVHPNREIAKKFHEEFVDAMKIAVLLGTDTIIGFSGCPGDCEDSKNPNWVTCAWPPEYLDILEWQWEKIIIPYWKETAALAKEIGIKKIAFEMHPGFCVYNPSRSFVCVPLSVISSARMWTPATSSGRASILAKRSKCWKAPSITSTQRTPRSMVPTPKRSAFWIRKAMLT